MESSTGGRQKPQRFLIQGWIASLRGQPVVERATRNQRPSWHSFGMSKLLFGAAALIGTLLLFAG